MTLLDNDRKNTQLAPEKKFLLKESVPVRTRRLNQVFNPVDLSRRIGAIIDKVSWMR